MGRVTTGGGWRAVLYTLKKAREAGGLWALWKAMRTKNACKTCAVGMGGQAGGMVNEAGHFPEVCKKSFQAMVADMQGAVKPSFFETYSIPQLRRFSPRELEHSGRLVQPVVLEKGSQHYRPLSWSEAMERIAAKLRATAPEESFFYFSGRSSNEAGFLLQLFARLYGTNHVNNCSYYCHQASGVGLASVIGSGAGTIQLDDMEKSDFTMLIGGNPASNHPRLMRTLMIVRRKGGKVVVVNPIVETGLVNFSVPSDPWALFFGAEIASSYVQPHVGGDLALVYGMMKRLVELQAERGRNAAGELIVDEPFLREHCTGWSDLAARIEALAWDEIVAASGVSKAEIDDLAGQYAESRRAVFAWTMGVTHHLHGAATVQAIAALALMRRMVGRPGAGLQPIRGHSNIQGMGTVGVTPTLKAAIFERLESHYGVTLPTMKGHDTLGCLDAAEAGRMRFALCLGGNLWGASPDATFTERALGKVDTVVYLSTSLNTGHAGGLGGEETIILPVLARDEEPEPSTQESMFSYIRLSDGGRPRHAADEASGPRAEVAIIAELARRVLGEGGPVNWEEMAHTSTIRRAIAAIVPGLEELAEIDATKREFSIPGRAIDRPSFPTDDGKAHLAVHDLPPAPDGLVLMTIRSEGQFNTVVYEEEDLYRNQTRRDIVLIHPDDIARFGLTAGGRCRIASTAGEMRGQIVSAFPEIRPGCVAMYYPESNLLVPKTADPLSRTPAYKSIAVTIDPDEALATSPGPRPELVGAGTPRDKMNQCG
ncbi:MAG: FdhF/YdeP family oxidoreductase [Planctomycetota bacterium]|nr:FdhF/YdeP family oxidoreductase [Planctomycetota bacterium]